MDENTQKQLYNATAEARNRIPFTEAAGAKLPRRAKAVDLRGEKIGKVRKHILKDEDKNVLGEFSRDKDQDIVFFYAPDDEGECVDLVGYVDKNNNLLTLDNDYIATIRYPRFFLILLFFFLGALTLVSTILGAYYISRSNDYIPTLFVTEDDGPEWRDDELIRVFENGVYNESKIHPGMEGVYKFRFENRNENRLNYELAFAEENDFSLNMGYRLRMDNVYVLGDAETYLSIEEMNLEDVIIAANSSVIYTLEWKWIDGSNDTFAGMNNATYTLHITFHAQTTAYFN
ncbi:MAG: hypothetical protein J6D37_00590 [Clostridia bacterium]|nr:hypothetical protein [Clostridia bacterium]